MSESAIGKHNGEKNPMYGKSGDRSPVYKKPEDRITILSQSIRTHTQYYDWRVNVLQRDLFVCQSCKKPSEGDLHAHHIKRFSDILREYNIKTVETALGCSELWDISNGICLCEQCHELLGKNGGLPTKIPKST